MWYELNGSWRTVRCAVYNGDDEDPAWTLVGGAAPEGLNFDSTKDAHGPQLLVASDTLYATWYERGGDLTSHPRFVRYNGDDTQPAWSFLDGGGPGGLARDPGEDAWWPRAAALGPYVAVAWTEREAGVYRVRASLYDAAWDRWSAVEPPQGLNYDPTQSAEYAHVAVVEGRVYIAWSERLDGALHVRVAMGTIH